MTSGPNSSLPQSQAGQRYSTSLDLERKTCDYSNNWCENNTGHARPLKAPTPTHHDGMWGDWGQLKNSWQNEKQKARCAERREGRLYADRRRGGVERRAEQESRRKGPGSWVSVLESDPPMSIAGCSSQGGMLRLISFCQSQFSHLFPDTAGTWAGRCHRFSKRDINISCFHHFPFSPYFRWSIFFKACAGSSSLISHFLSFYFSLSFFISFVLHLFVLPPSFLPSLLPSTCINIQYLQQWFKHNIIQYARNSCVSKHCHVIRLTSKLARNTD